jgi:uncharacterized protein YktB (UPF0637 family)
MTTKSIQAGIEMVKKYKKLRPWASIYDEVIAIMTAMLTEDGERYATEDDVAKAIAEAYIELRDRIASLEDKTKEDFFTHMEANEDIYQRLNERLARLEKQVRVLKDYSHFHKNQEGITFPYNPDYEPERPAVEEKFCSLPSGVARTHQNGEYDY